MIKLVGVIIEQDTDPEVLVIKRLLEEFWGELTKLLKTDHKLDINSERLAWAISLNKKTLFPLMGDYIHKKVTLDKVVDAILTVNKQQEYMDSVCDYAMDRYNVDFFEPRITEAVMGQIDDLLPKIDAMVARNASLDEGYRLVMQATVKYSMPTNTKH